jgi:MoxR-like ATPase
MAEIFQGAISAEARKAIRAAIIAHPKWDDYRKANNLSLASMVRDDYLRAAAALNVDVPTIAAEHGTGRTMQNRATSTANVNFPNSPISRGLAAAGIGHATETAPVTAAQINALNSSTATIPAAPAIVTNEAAEMSHAQDVANARAAAEFEAAANSEAEAPEFDMFALPPIPAPIGEATLAKIDSIVRLAVGEDISIKDLYKSARLTAWCADALKTELLTQREAPIDPRAAALKPFLKPSLDFVPPSWTREFVDYLEIGATIAVVGPAGNGKTTGARKLLERAGFTVYEFDCTDATLPQDLIGRTTLRQEHGATVTEWTAGPIAKAFADPKGAVLLNEYDALDPRTGMALQSALEAADTRRVTAPDSGEQLASHGRCPIVLTLNTIGHGATVAYQGRNALDGANRDRIEIVMSGYENEREILTAHGFAPETAERLANWAVTARERLATIGSMEILSNRRLLTAAALIDRCGHSLTDATTRAFTGRMAERDRAAFAA